MASYTIELRTLAELRALWDACAQAAANSDPDEMADSTDADAAAHAQFVALERYVSAHYVDAIDVPAGDTPIAPRVREALLSLGVIRGTR